MPTRLLNSITNCYIVCVWVGWEISVCNIRISLQTYLSKCRYPYHTHKSMSFLSHWGVIFYETLPFCHLYTVTYSANLRKLWSGRMMGCYIQTIYEYSNILSFVPPFYYGDLCVGCVCGIFINVLSVTSLVPYCPLVCSNFRNIELFPHSRPAGI